MDWLPWLLRFLLLALVCVGVGYVSVRQRARKPRAADVLVEALRFLVALGIFSACVYGPMFLLDLKSEAGMFVMITAVFWGPLLMILGGVLAWIFLKLTSTQPRRTIGDIAREKAEEQARRNLRP